MSFFVVINHLSGFVSFPCVYIYCIFVFFICLTFMTLMLNAYDDLKYFGWYEYLNFNGRHAISWIKYGDLISTVL